MEDSCLWSQQHTLRKTLWLLLFLFPSETWLLHYFGMVGSQGNDYSDKPNPFHKGRRRHLSYLLEYPIRYYDASIIYRCLNSSFLPPSLSGVSMDIPCRALRQLAGLETNSDLSGKMVKPPPKEAIDFFPILCLEQKLIQKGLQSSTAPFDFFHVFYHLPNVYI